MSQVITVRDARTSEARDLSELAFRSKAVWGYSPAFMTACRQELTLSAATITHPGHVVRVAECDGKIAGFHALVRLSAEACELEALFVDPGRLGIGIGRALIRDAAAQARARGARSIVIQGDPNAEGFYLRAGAVRTGERESASIVGRMLPEYRLPLDRSAGSRAG